jgi:hypothetical protein
VSSVTAPATARTFRLPRSAYLIALILSFCVLPLAFANTADLSGSGGGSISSGQTSEIVVGPRVLLLLIPVLAIVFVARAATIVDGSGIRIRALFGSRRVPWDEVRGLSLDGHTVYAVFTDGGAIRLPCVRVADLGAVARASGGRLPAIPTARPKHAPSRRRRR